MLLDFQNFKTLLLNLTQSLKNLTIWTYYIKAMVA